jgi:fructokinase
LPRFQSPKLEVINDIISKNYLNPEVYLFDRVTPSTLKLAGNYREEGALIFFEPINLKSTDGLEKAINLSHIVKYAGNESEKRLKGSVNDQIMQNIRSFGPTLVIQTLGKYGLSFINGKKSKPQYRKSFEINRIYDTSGAGDWCTVGFLFYLKELALDNNVRLVETLESNPVCL